MMGTSYNGTLPIAAASTGVEGLKAIVPISAISDWYDYYRANGMTRAPGGFQGEDLDVLSEYIYSRNDDPQRTICWPGIQDVAVKQDRASGNRSAFWDERNYMPGVRAGKVKAASLIAHGNGDNNVMTKNAVQYYEELKKQGVPRAVLLPPGWSRRRAAGLPAEPVVLQVPLQPGQRRREPAEVLGRARDDGLPAA